MDWNYLFAAAGGGILAAGPLLMSMWAKKNAIATQRAKDDHDLEQTRGTDAYKGLLQLIEDLKKHLEYLEKQLIDLRCDQHSERSTCDEAQKKQNMKIADLTITNYQQAAQIKYLEQRVSHLEECKLPETAAAVATALVASNVIAAQVVKDKAVQVEKALDKKADTTADALVKVAANAAIDLPSIADTEARHNERNVEQLAANRAEIEKLKIQANK